MPDCRVCLRTFQALKFKTKHIGICGRCVSSVNAAEEPASVAMAKVAEMLLRGMERNAYKDLESPDEWKRQRARRILENLHIERDAALPNWLNGLLADRENRGKPFTQIRAERRGLLRMSGPRRWEYPGNWPDVARRIRARDAYRCACCQNGELILDVHHIVYLSNYGTNQQSNLITLCRPCHEKEHGREFGEPDFGEFSDPESLSPMTPPPGVSMPPWVEPEPPKQTPAPTLTPRAAPSPRQQPAPTEHPGPPTIKIAPTPRETRAEVLCPTCNTTLLVKPDLPLSQRLRCLACKGIFDRLPKAETESQSSPKARPLDTPSDGSHWNRMRWALIWFCGSATVFYLLGGLSGPAGFVALVVAITAYNIVR